MQVTALNIACCVQKNDIARLLITSGADPNIAARTNTGRLYTPLFWAVQHSDEQLCRTLLEAGARADLGRDLLRSKHISFQVKQLVQPFLMWDRMYHVLLDKFQPHIFSISEANYNNYTPCFNNFNSERPMCSVL